VLFTVNKPKQPRYQVFILGLRHHDTIVGSPAYMTYWTFPIYRSTYVVRAWGNERDLAGSLGVAVLRRRFSRRLAGCDDSVR
jgi:hypothetical protein